ncbi:MAG TPA: ATP-binding protein [Deltaproteobacteria bacterium]|nr:ATP-binding protein [Deltaproteobacteria bacterium]HQH99724.1 ATP-binding protein [Deltaproteobacteria bacterium]
MISKRTREIVYIFVILGMIALLSIARTNIRNLQALSLSSNIVIFAVISLNVVLLVLVIFLVTRNLAKLLMERQKGVLGTKLRTKLVIAFVTLTIVPTMVLFFTSVIFLTSSMEGWLSSSVETAIEESMNVANIYYKEASAEAIHYASSISAEITERRLLKEENLDILKALLSDRMALFRLSSVEVLSAQSEELVKITSPSIGAAGLPSPQSSRVHEAMEGKTMSIVRRTGKADVIEGIVPIRSSFNLKDVVGVLVVDYYIPESLSGRLGIIRGTFTDYIQSLRVKGPIKTNYIIILSSITLLVLFSAVWFGINISKGLLNPIEKLVEGTQRISRGDLSFSIDVQSNDELGLLVQDFNKMVSDLTESRKQLEKAYTDLANRNRYILTMLNNISTGVITLQPDDTVVYLNPAASEMLAITQESAHGKKYDEIFRDGLSAISTDLIENFKKSKGITTQKQIGVSVGGKRLTLLGHASFLYDDNDEHLGTVVVFDDLTQMQKMERMAAWREVARRIAHEVKNPLTPIQLSAQRLRRRYLDKLAEDGQVFDECTRVIIKEVDEMKHLVNEFSAFAKMPSCMPVPGDLNKVVQDAVTLYRQAHPQVEYEITIDEGMPMVEIDSPQMSRAIGNLLENASTAVIEASNPQKKVSIKTAYDSDVHIATLDISDTGTGISNKVKERLFEPYFSTKRGGTGLGLVIVNRIVSDHNGFIRVKDNVPVGTVFSIELPVKE